jgi:hypothetical protein
MRWISVAGLLLVVSASASASAADAPSQGPEADDTLGMMSVAEDGPLGEAEEPLAGALVLACALAGALIAEHVCADYDFWPNHCPEGTAVFLNDLPRASWPSKRIRVPCDTLKTLTCGTAGFGGGDMFSLFCRPL